MKKRERAINWAGIERDYRGTVVSVREIARQHALDEAAVRRKARDGGWTRPDGGVHPTPADTAGIAERSRDLTGGMRAAGGALPLEYMLGVMRDPDADPARRDRMAIACAPYCHRKAAEVALGKKEQAKVAADTAGAGTDWGDDLDVTAGLN